MTTDETTITFTNPEWRRISAALRFAAANSNITEMIRDTLAAAECIDCEVDAADLGADPVPDDLSDSRYDRRLVAILVLG